MHVQSRTRTSVGTTPKPVSERMADRLIAMGLMTADQKAAGLENGSIVASPSAAK